LLRNSAKVIDDLFSCVTINMTNPYESAFGNEKIPDTNESAEGKPIDFSGLPPMDESTTEALDELLQACQQFTQEAASFAALLSKTRAVDHDVSLVLRNDWMQYLVKVEDPHQQGSLRGERRYYELLENKFRNIIVPMKQLAQQHQNILQQFFSEVDEYYFSPNKTALEIKREVSHIQESIVLQRQILHDAQGALKMLTAAMKATEKRMQQYVNAGGENNISASELALLSRNRQQLTDGKEHNFNYSFFELNVLDRVSLLFGKVAKETTAQYLQKLSLALEANKA
jgi:hypothetical protein